MSDSTDAAQKPNQPTSSTAVSGSVASKAVDSERSEVRDGREVHPKTVSGGPVGFDANPHGNYDLMSLTDLRAEAKRQGVWISPDAERAHLVSALRAGITTTRY